MKADAELEPFVRLIEALEPWLEEVVHHWRLGTSALPPRSPCTGTGVSAAHNARQRRCRSIENRSQGDKHSGALACGGISRGVYRGGPASGDALPFGSGRPVSMRSFSVRLLEASTAGRESEKPRG